MTNQYKESFNTIVPILKESVPAILKFIESKRIIENDAHDTNPDIIGISIEKNKRCTNCFEFGHKFRHNNKQICKRKVNPVLLENLRKQLKELEDLDKTFQNEDTSSNASEPRVSKSPPTPQPPAKRRKT